MRYFISFFILCVFFICSTLIHAQELSIEKKREKHFDQKITKLFLSKKIPTEKTSLLSESIIEFEDNILFLDSSGNAKKVIKNAIGKIWCISKQGKYVVLFERVKEATTSKNGLDKFKFWDHAGKFLWEKQMATGFETYDDIDHIFISDKDGTAVLVYSFLDRMEFFNETGTLFKTIAPGISGNFRGEMSHEGKCFAFVTKVRGKIFVVLYTHNGEKQWEYEIQNEWRNGYVKIFPEGEYVFASAYHFEGRELKGTTVALSKEGELLNKFNWFFSESAISQENNYLVLAHIDKVHFLRVKDTKVIFEKNNLFQPQIGSQIFRIFSLSVLNNGEKILVGSARNDILPPQEPTIFVLDKSGNTVLTEHFPQKNCILGSLDFVRFSPNGRSMILIFEDSIVQYEIQ